MASSSGRLAGFYVQKSLGGLNPKLKSIGSLKGKTVFVSGGSRGIGLAIGIRAAQDGANVVIAAKTIETNPKLDGTIYSAADACISAGGNALAVMCNIQNEDNVRDAIQQAVNKFGGIDILVNSASAIHIEPSENISMKRYDLMHSINGRGTFLVSKYAIPYLKKSSNGHIITMAPPIQTVDQPHWFRQAGTAYTSAKLQMSLQVIGLSAELCGNHLPNSTHVGVNGLWPRTTIATAAIQNILGDDNMMRRSRSAEIMADAAYAIMCSDNKRNTGNFWIDDEVMVGTGAVDLSKYRIDPNLAEHELCPDLFV